MVEAPEGRLDDVSPDGPGQPAPEGARAVPEGTTTRECAGSLILVQREFVRFQESDSLREYRRSHPGGLTRDGLAVLANRALANRVTFVGDGDPDRVAGRIGLGRGMTLPDLNDVDVQHEEQVQRWEVRR